MIRQSFIAFLLLTSLVPVLTYAQLSENSGSMQNDSQEAKDDRALRILRLSGATLTNMDDEGNHKLIDAMVQNHIECKERLRRANKTQAFSITASCLRADLMTERSVLEERMKRTYPDASRKWQTAIQSAQRETHDAVDALIRGIDAGIFRDEVSLQQSVLKLHQKYRTNAMNVRRRAVLDRMLTRIALVLAWMDQEEQSVEMQAARSCLVVQESKIRQTLQDEQRKWYYERQLQAVFDCLPSVGQ